MEINANVTGMRIMTSERPRITAVRGGTGHPMRWGDRIFVRIIRGANCIDEFLSTRVADFTELLGEIRSRLRGTRGLVEMQIRNASEGWSIRRPLMLYNDSFAPRGFGNVRPTEPLAPRLSPVMESRIHISSDAPASRWSPHTSPFGRPAVNSTNQTTQPTSYCMLKPYDTH